MKNIVDDYYKKNFSKEMFIPCAAPEGFPNVGECWTIGSSVGKGYYWIYNSNKHYNIKIHDFYFHNDAVINLAIPECLSITFYESIAGEELNPYRRLQPNVVKSFLGGYAPFKALIHKNIPIRSIGIEYEPDYYETYLKNQYNNTPPHPSEIFRSIDETADFPEMTLLLNQLKNYKGKGISADLFFDGKAAEALSIIFEHHRKKNEQMSVSISNVDKEMLDMLASYIGDHYANNLTIELLSKIACMGTTKLKKSFKAYFGCTILDYIQATRIGQAEQLLAYTDLPVNQIVEAVGYSNAGRFASLFRSINGVLPMEYRKISRGQRN